MDETFTHGLFTGHANTRLSFVVRLLDNGCSSKGPHCYVGCL